MRTIQTIAHGTRNALVVVTPVTWAVIGWRRSGV
jgi:hypothetical protein